jgi:hypothetical protein
MTTTIQIGSERVLLHDGRTTLSKVDGSMREDPTAEHAGYWVIAGIEESTEQDRHVVRGFVRRVGMDEYLWTSQPSILGPDRAEYRARERELFMESGRHVPKE